MGGQFPTIYCQSRYTPTPKAGIEVAAKSKKKKAVVCRASRPVGTMHQQVVPTVPQMCLAYSARVIDDHKGESQTSQNCMDPLSSISPREESQTGHWIAWTRCLLSPLIRRSRCLCTELVVLGPQAVHIEVTPYLPNNVLTFVRSRKYSGTH